MVGRTLGHYEIIEPLGVGAFTDVYATHESGPEAERALDEYYARMDNAG